MSWNITMVDILRVMIGDDDASSYTWSQSQLEKFIAISTIETLTSLNRWSSIIPVTYSVDLAATGSYMIQPDIVDNGPEGLVNLILLKSSCKLTTTQYNKTASQGAGWKIVDDKSTIDGTKALEAAKFISEGFCKSYTDALAEFKLGNQAAGHSVLTPYADVSNVRLSERGYRP